MHILDSESINSYIRKIVDEFEKHPEDGRYLNVINPPVNGARKGDFFPAENFYLEPTGAVSQVQNDMSRSQVCPYPKETYLRHCETGQNAKDHI